MVGKIYCDILVVGSGTTGCMAAWRAAQYGAKVIILEKSPHSYKPACAEGMSKIFADMLPFKIPKQYIIHATNSVYLWTKEIEIEKKGMLWKSYMIDRKGFQSWLWNKAKEAGSEAHLSAEVIGLNEKEDYINSVTVNNKGKLYEIKPKAIIAADGAHSILRKETCLDSGKDIFGYVISHEYRNMNVERPYSENLYLGDFAPYAYGYIFPKSRTSANVGAGIIDTRGIYKKTEHEKLFNRFCDMISDQIANAKSVGNRSGNIVIKFQNNAWRYKNVLFAGDSANQNIKPYVEGIATGMMFGSLAGKYAANFAKNGSEKELEKYENLKNKFSFLFGESHNIENYIETLYKNRAYVGEFPKRMLGLFANILNEEDISQLRENEINEILQKWNDSKIKQINKSVLEYITALYLKLRKVA